MKAFMCLATKGASGGMAAVLTGILGWSAAASAAEPPAGSLTKEHFAFTAMLDCLDGPRREAMAGRNPRVAFDEKGNLYFFSEFFCGSGAIRCIRTDGRVVTVSGNDYFVPDLRLAEGPASAFGHPAGVRGFTFAQPTGWLVAVGVPGEGEDKGCLYASDPHVGVVRIFRNGAKGNRWWFERIAGGGKAKVPAKRGESVGAMEADLGYVNGLQLTRDRKLCLYAKGSFLEYDSGKLTCLLGPDNYGPAGAPRGKGGGANTPSEGFMGGDGSFYLCYYYGGGAGVTLYRASADGTKLDPLAKNNGEKGKNGDAMTESGWHCGPHLRPNRNSAVLQPPDVLITSTHDENTVRRIMNGRTASLCVDGQWREQPDRATAPTVRAANDWYVGPAGTAVCTYSGEDFGVDCRMWFIRGIDWAKPTADSKR